MKVSTKGRYALRMMLDLALQGDEVVRIKDISLRQEISEKYLEQIVSVLKKAGYVWIPGWMAEAIHAAGRRDARRLSCGPWLMMLLTVS